MKRRMKFCKKLTETEKTAGRLSKGMYYDFLSKHNGNMPVEWVLQKLTIGGIRSVLRMQITNWMLVGIWGRV